MELQHVVAAQISNHRNRLNLSQAELATRAAISQALLERLEEGRADASLADIGGLAKALGVEPKELLAPPPGPQSVYPYERFRFADDALARRCGLAEELVGAATGTMDLVAIIQLSKILTEHVQTRTAARKAGESAPVRRGKVAAFSDLVILAVNMLMVCHAAGFAPPAELARLFVLLHGLEARPGNGVQDRVSRNRVLTCYMLHPEASLREASRTTKVPVTTIRHWRTDPEFQETLAGMQEAHRRWGFQSIW